MTKLRSSYNEEENPPYPELEVELSDPTSLNKVLLKAKIDTGFSGSFLVGLDDYTRVGLQFHEQPERAAVGRLSSGATVSLRASEGILKVMGYQRQISCLVYTMPVLLKPLVGRKIINSWRTVLDGPRKTIEISF